jgi:hypothetical protein
MRTWVIIWLAVLACSSLVLARKEETVEQLKARVDAAKPAERIDLCLKIAERQLDAADKLYTGGKIDEARTDIQEVVSYSEQARDTATSSGKKLKNAEISVRKMANKLRDMKHALNFEDQAPVQEAIDHLERVRTDLLARMFGSGK